MVFEQINHSKWQTFNHIGVPTITEIQTYIRWYSYLCYMDIKVAHVILLIGLQGNEFRHDVHHQLVWIYHSHLLCYYKKQILPWVHMNFLHSLLRSFISCFIITIELQLRNHFMRTFLPCFLRVAINKASSTPSLRFIYKQLKLLTIGFEPNEVDFFKEIFCLHNISLRPLPLLKTTYLHTRTTTFSSAVSCFASKVVS